MKFGLILPNNWGVADPQDIVDIAVKAEDMGFNSVWVNHHIVHVGYVLDRLGTRPYYDALTVLTYVAAKTERVKLGTSVLVLPYTNPLALAKTLSTIDVMSGGRVVAGVGVGALKPENDALSSDYATRGAYSDEAIDIMKALWTQDDPAYDGKSYQFSDIKFEPKPTQKPHIPILIGGASNPALRRVARAGNGWHPQGMSPSDFGARLADLKVHMDAAGRDMSGISVHMRLELDVLDSPAADQPDRMIGTPDQLLGAIEAYTDAGLDEIVLATSTWDVPKFHKSLDDFGEKVMGKL